MNTFSKHEPWEIVEVCKADCKNTKSEILQFHNEWLKDISRQTTFTTHEHTFMYKLIDFDYEWYPEKPSNVKYVNSLSPESMVEVNKIYDILEKHCNGKVIHSEIINMKPKSRIRIHKDRGDLLYVARRFHIPLKTNAETFFIVNDNKHFLEEGFIYELNNIQYHGVRNDSSEHRVHLIIDVLPSEFCENVGFGNE